MLFSIILPVLNEAASIADCLDSVRNAVKQLPQGNSVEVAAFDQGSTDGSVALVQQAGIPVFDQSASSTVAALRNAGARWAKGDILVFLDADMRVPPNWLAAAAAHYAGGFDGILGFVDTVPQEANLVARILNPPPRNRRREVLDVDFLPSRNLFVPAQRFWKLGAFDGEMITAEDKEFTLRARRSGVRVLSCPEAPVVHLGYDRDFRQMARKEFWRQGHTLDLADRLGFSWRTLRHPLLSAWHVLLPLAFLFSLLLGWVLAAWTALALWLTPSLILTIRAYHKPARTVLLQFAYYFLRWNVAGLALCPQLFQRFKKLLHPKPAALPSGLVVRRIAGFDAPGLAQAWDALLADSWDDSLCITREWLSAWWEVYGNGQLLLLQVENAAGEVLGIAPLYRGTWKLKSGMTLRALRVVGDEEVSSDFLALPLRRGSEDAAMRALFEHVYANERFDVLAVRDASTLSRSCLALERAAREHGLWISRGKPMACPFIPLPETFEAFMAVPDKTYINIVKRSYEKIRKKHTLEYAFSLEAADPDHWLEAFFQQHTRRWEATGMRGAFTSERKRLFYKKVAHQAQATDWQAFSTLRVDGECVAMDFSWYRNKVYYGMQTSASEQGRRIQAGNVLHYLTISKLIADGAQKFSMLRGDEAYKYKWGAKDEFIATRFVWCGRAGRLGFLMEACYTLLKAHYKKTRSALSRWYFKLLGQSEKDSTNMRDSNQQIYETPKTVSVFSKLQSLFPAEENIFSLFSDSIKNRSVLDLGCGTGRTTGYLLPLANRYRGCDYSAAMVEQCQKAFPKADIRRMDARNLHAFKAGAFDCVLFSYNGIDGLDHEGRLRILAEAHRVLRPKGLFIFSSHNRAAITSILPRLRLAWNPRRLAKNALDWLLSWPNYLKNRNRHCFLTEYALITDSSAHYNLLHYYIDPPNQLRQAEAAGFTPLAMFDLRTGEQLELGDMAPQAKHVYYVLQKNV